MTEPARHKRSGLTMALLALVLVGVAVLATWNSDDRDAGASREGGVLVTTEAVGEESALRVGDVDAAEPEQIAVPVAAAPVDSAPADSFELRLLARYMEEGNGSGTKITDEPAAGVVFRIGVMEKQFGATPTVFREVVTDAEGRAVSYLTRAELDTVAHLSDARMSMAYEGPGLLGGNVRRYLRNPEIEGLDVEVGVTRGLVLRGALLDPEGRPCPGEVQLLDEHGKMASSTSSVWENGSFRLSMKAQGNFRVWGSGSSGAKWAGDGVTPVTDLGTGLSEPFEVRWGEPLKDIVIRVAAAGELRGRLVDERGEPAAGVGLWASLADPATGQFAFGAPRTTDGETRGDTTSAADGSFRIGGLQRGAYWLIARARDDGTHRTDQRLTEKPIETGGAPLEFLISRPHLLVRVVREDGEPPVERLHVLDFVGPTPRFFDRATWPPPGLGLLAARAPGASPGKWGQHGLELRQLGSDLFSIDVESGVPVDLCLVGPTTPPDITRVEIPPDRYRHVVQLTLPRDRPSGELSLRLVDGQGAPIHEQVRVRLVEPSTGFELWSSRIEHGDADDWPLEIDVPAGRYLLVVDGIAQVDSQHGTVMARRSFGGDVLEVDVQPARSLEVVARLSEAARLDVELVGAVSGADFQAVRNAHFGSDRGDVAWGLALLARLRLEQLGRFSEPVQFLRMEGFGWNRRQHLYGTLALDRRAKSEALTPGRYTLVATLPGGREQRRDVELHAGQTTSVMLSFD